MFALFKHWWFNLHYFSFQGWGLKHPSSLDRVRRSGYWDGLQLPLPRSHRFHHWHHGADLQGTQRQVRLWFSETWTVSFWLWQLLVMFVMLKFFWGSGGTKKCTQITCHRGSSFFCTAQQKKWILTISIPDVEIQWRAKLFQMLNPHYLVLSATAVGSF